MNTNTTNKQYLKTENKPKFNKFKHYAKNYYRKKKYTSLHGNQLYTIAQSPKNPLQKRLSYIERQSMRTPVTIIKNLAQKRDLLTGRFANELNNQLQFSDQVYRYRIKERMWSQLMEARRHGFSVFLQTCRNFLKQMEIGTHPDLKYMLQYIYYIKLYLQNDFFSFAVTKFVKTFLKITETLNFNDYYKTLHFLFVKKAPSLRLFLLSKNKLNRLNFLFFVINNSYIYILTRAFQFFWSFYLTKFPKRMSVIGKVTQADYMPFQKMLTSFKHIINSKIVLNAMTIDNTKDWHTKTKVDFIPLIQSVDKKSICYPSWQNLGVSFTNPASISEWNFYLSNEQLPKPRFDFLFWKEISQAFNLFEFSTQIYTAQIPNFIAPLSEIKVKSRSLFNNFAYFALAKSFLYSIGYFFGHRLYFNKEQENRTLSFGFQNITSTKKEWIYYSNTFSLLKQSAQIWHGWVFPVMFNFKFNNLDFLLEIKNRTYDLLTLPKRSSSFFLNIINKDLAPWYNYFSHNWILLYQALENTTIKTKGIFQWFKKLKPFFHYNIKPFLPRILKKRYKSLKNLDFSLPFPNTSEIKNAVLPYTDFRQMRLRRKINVSAQFARQYNLFLFKKFAGNFVKKGYYKRIFKAIQVSLSLLKESLVCKSSRRLFSGAVRLTSPELISVPRRRGSKKYEVFVLAKTQRLWFHGIKLLYTAVNIRRIINWQEKDYTLAWALSDEIHDVLKSKQDCVSLKFIRERAKLLTELRRFPTRRRGLVLGQNDPYQHLFELRQISNINANK
jgi:hypothetical protein